MIFWSIPAAVALDSAMGDPEVSWHPVRGIGWCVRKLEGLIRRLGLDSRIGGVILLAGTVLLAAVPVAFVVWTPMEPWARFLVETAVLYFSIALGSLLHTGRRVQRLLESGDLPAARRAVSEICGRDTAALDAAGVTRAAVESVAENSVDGFTAPLFYAVLFGPLGAWVYRIANTLDSMVGHEDESYRHLGWASAKFDDLLNYIPARLTAALLGLWSPAVGGSVSGSFGTVARFAGLHPSPNAGWPESAAAGALGIRLGGPAVYGGEELQKPYLGNGIVIPTPRHIHLTNRLAALAGLTFAILSTAMAWAIPS